VYEQDLGEIEPGAYAVRVTQTRPGTTPLGRSLGLVAPTPAEYRVLGANEPFLAALRAATGGTEIETAAEVWTHDLRATSRYTDLWPLLLIVALLLWPLDVAFRRVSIGRRELVAARGWVTGLGRRRRRMAPRPAVSEGLLAARDRASSIEARSAIRAAAEGGVPARNGDSPPAPGGAAPPRLPPAGPAGAGAARPTPQADDAATADTLARLRDAKRRARER